MSEESQEFDSQVKKENKKYRELFDEENIISKYTSEQADEDGILCNIVRLWPVFEKGPINYVTSNLMEKEYLGEEKPSFANVLDLVGQAINIMKKHKPDYFYSGLIELPDGSKTKIFISQNETGKYTLMLPVDY